MVSLKAYGPMRFFAAGFLLFWLCGWLAGECFALWFLGNGLVAIISGTPFLSGKSPVQVGPAIAVGAFLLLWLALWTVGGIAAISEFLRLVAGEDRLSAEGGSLTVMHRRGPFVRRREFPRDTLQRLYLTATRCALAVDSSGATIELSRLGSLEERSSAAKTLRSELGLSDVDSSPNLGSALPKGWEEIITPEGERAVVPSQATRRVQARVAAVFALLLGALAVTVVQKSFLNPGLIVAVIQLVLGAVGLGCAAAWLGRGRMEWRIGSGRVTLRRRFGSKVKDVFEAKRFELAIDKDSDGDTRFSLIAVSDPAPGAPGTAAHPPSTAPATITLSTSSGTASASLATWTSVLKNRRRITSVGNNPSTPRQLGAYLARAAGIPFEDRTTPEARQAELQLIKEQLEKAGPVGRFAMQFLIKAQERTRKQG
jgi:hypothetical protein